MKFPFSLASVLVSSVLAYPHEYGAIGNDYLSLAPVSDYNKGNVYTPPALASDYDATKHYPPVIALPNDYGQNFNGRGSKHGHGRVKVDVRVKVKGHKPQHSKGRYDLY
ncbi:hypothetical protein DSO57_1017427 [Entomophthora muscae]|uniref:Uncharacterized protein n=1 Tax=Entomophthora muscae TaxID=34485 RepID=A0ACC2UDT3_9FUNG|nr:hypothetical protein DSO57_1017427 [Entomophthora muscae]